MSAGADETTTTVATTTTAESTTTTAAPTTTAADVADDESEAEDASAPATFDPDATSLTAQFERLDRGVYRVDTIGTPFSFEVSQDLFVQPNSDAFFVLTAPSSQGPDDRDVVFFRVSDLSDPSQPAAELEDQEPWPANDIEGWLAAIIDDVIISNRAETTVGGRSAVQFDLQLSDDAECGDGFCVGFQVPDDARRNARGGARLRAPAAPLHVQQLQASGRRSTDHTHRALTPSDVARRVAATSQRCER